MKIKRFEASTMSEALRMIKKEFGDDAVILSAKSMKKSSGILGGKRPGKVVVTAAIDHEVAAGDLDAAAQAAQAADSPGGSTATAGGGNRAYSKFSFLKNYQPITRTGRQKVKPKIVQVMSEADAPSAKGDIQDRLQRQGVSPECSAELAEQVDALVESGHPGDAEASRALAQALSAMQVVSVDRSAKNGSAPHTIVMAGPPGVGKTSAVVKLATRHIIENRRRVGIICLDNQRVGGADALERCAKIMGAPVRYAVTTDQVTQALRVLESVDLILVDTPGLNHGDHQRLETLKDQLAVFDRPDIHLLISATAQEKVMERTISFYQPLGIHRLLFTKLDWALDIGPVINQAVASGTPITYLCDSAGIQDGIHDATAADLSARLLGGVHGGFGAVIASCGDSARPGCTGRETAHYVANRNSDIFHHSSCTSVKRINENNMVIFQNPAEAMGRHFKPCRMCCSELLMSTPRKRQAKRYAGVRC